MASNHYPITYNQSQINKLHIWYVHKSRKCNINFKLCLVLDLEGNITLIPFYENHSKPTIIASLPLLSLNLCTCLNFYGNEMYISAISALLLLKKE